ncbi:4Fe-4S dicluster domain-containing protein, partial [Oligoflexaceae bacterium]|nr:4Fe-4S dicluster domain-containing protein [Oligoflexaceae bacterium]
AKAEDSISGEPVTSGVSVTIEKTGRIHRLAAMQKHNDIGNRSDIIKTVALDKAKAEIRKTVDVDTVPDLYPQLETGEYRWGLSIDLNACVGCSACMVACSVENNIPQIGRQQILLGREMHWIRLDRYFNGSMDNPEVTIQPVMCQQCNHAPCEAVCPVYATVHDPEGLNTQTYNRCVGTRYCANACPYKVRRFNWFTHKWNVIAADEKHRNPRALNPDVTVRTRGIMEKCTFCIQRIRGGKYKAKNEDRKVFDSEIKTACQQVCPTNAIVFGDLKDQRTAVHKLRKSSRSFLMLGGDPEHKHYGIKTLPNVNYLAKVKNKVDEKDSGHHG